MTNQIAIGLALAIIAGGLYDLTSNGGAFLFGTAQQFVRLVDWLRFWG